MPRQFMVLIFCGAALALAGCNDKSSPKPQKQAAAQDGPAWQLSLQSKCLDGAVEECVAFYGFMVDANGKYQVGPGPSHQIKTGTLEEMDLKTLSESIAPYLRSLNEETAETCNPEDSLVTNDTLTLTRQSRQKAIIHTGDSGLCFYSSTAEQAATLHKAIRDLAEKLYPLPFPDACEDAIGQVEAIYPGVQSCSKDTDCGYFTPAFEIIPPGTLQYVITDDCSRLKPLVVGNIGAVIHEQPTLVTTLENAQAVCGQNIVRYDCTGVSGFQATDGAPVCVQNRCRINPSILR